MEKVTSVSIAHLFDDSIFLRHYSHFISTFFKQERHEFITNTAGYNNITFSNNDGDANIIMFLRSENIRKPLQFIKRTVQTLREMDKSKLIIVHSFTGVDLLYFCMSPHLLKKTVWVIWGYDLYDYRSRKNSLYSRIHFLVKSQVIKKIPYVVARTPDYNLLQKWYKSKAELLLVEPLYTNGEFESSKLTIKNDTSTPIKITLGNSATKTNHHLEALDILSKYRNENLHLYIPLSYGDMEYAEIVKKRAKEIFGTKVTILDKFMGQDEYNKHLSQMDIGIFNIDRQQALGNISYLLATGTKIYLDSASPLWEIFDGFSFQVHSVSDILSEDFDAFTSLDIYELTYNSEHAKEIYSEKHSVECWNRVFNLAKGK